MSTLVGPGFSDAIQFGLGNVYRVRYGVESTVDDSTSNFNSTVGIDGSSSGTVSSNPEAFDPQSGDFSQSGSTAVSFKAPTFESDQDGQTINQFKVQVKRTSGANWVDYGIWNSNGSGFGQSFDLGTEVTVQDWNTDAKRDGIAEALVSGADNLSADIYLLNGSGSRFGESWASNTSPNETIIANDGGVGYNNDKTFTNTTSSSRTVGGVEVVWGSGNLLIQGSFSNITLDANNKITFTTLEVNFSGIS